MFFLPTIALDGCQNIREPMQILIFLIWWVVESEKLVHTFYGKTIISFCIQYFSFLALVRWFSCHVLYHSVKRKPSLVLLDMINHERDGQECFNYDVQRWLLHLLSRCYTLITSLVKTHTINILFSRTFMQCKIEPKICWGFHSNTVMIIITL